MAKYLITYKCGHQGYRQLYGKIASREEYVNWAGNNLLCPDCQLKQREAKNEAQAEANKEAGLPVLTGTPAQVKWAESIRYDFLERLGSLVGSLGKGKDEEAEKTLADLEAKLRARYSGISEARTWIDKRDFFKGYGREDYIRDLSGLMRAEKA